LNTWLLQVAVAVVVLQAVDRMQVLVAVVLEVFAQVLFLSALAVTQLLSVPVALVVP
jgi:hypothetical protein